MKFVYFVEDALENLVKNVGKVKFASKILKLVLSSMPYATSLATIVASEHSNPYVTLRAPELMCNVMSSSELSNPYDVRLQTLNEYNARLRAFKPI